MASIKEIPNFEFSGFYFFEIEADIRRFWRLMIPELTEEADESISVQLARGWSLPHHVLNTRLDIAANESYLPTARLPETVRLMLELIDFKLSPATPAVANLVMEFSSLFTAETLIVPRESQFATEDTEDSPQIIYEAIRNNVIRRTDRLSHIFPNPAITIYLSQKNEDLFRFNSFQLPKEGDLIFQEQNTAIVSEVIGDHSLRINDAKSINVGEARLSTSNFESDKLGQAIQKDLTFPFAAKGAGDTIYFIQDSVMWNRFDIVVNQFFRTGLKGVWEFYDGTAQDENPNKVINQGTTLRMNVDTLLGSGIDRSGTVVRITIAQTSSSEEVVSQFDGVTNFIETTGLLGQINPSLVSSDYTVGTIWSPLKINTNSTFDEGEFSRSGQVSFELPQDQKQSWSKTTINGKSGFAIRFRVQSVDKKPSRFVGSEFNAEGLDDSNFKIKVQIDSFAAVEIDVTENGGSLPVTIADIVANINRALGAINPSLSNTVDIEHGQLRFTAPDASLGKSSVIQFLAPSSQDATNELLGLSESAHPHKFIGVGGQPIFDEVKIREGKQFLLFQVVQGETVGETLSSSDGSPDQEYKLSFGPLIEGSLNIEVDEGAGFISYAVVPNFLNSDSSSRHLIAKTDTNGETTIQFGNGRLGKIPPPGVDNLRATSYRIGASTNQDGNVGSRAININLAGVSFVNEIFNPRPATGFAPRQGTTPESLAQAKIDGPASLRTLGKAITENDIEQLAIQFTSSSSGARPIVRSKAISESFGIKTVELLVVGNAGHLLNESQRREVNVFFNGNKTEGITGSLVVNHEVTTVNYQPRIINVEAVVEGGNEEAIKNALVAFLNPEAKFDDGLTFIFEFGGVVRTSLIISEIASTDRVGIKNVNLISPASDIILNERELPLVRPENIKLTIKERGDNG